MAEYYAVLSKAVAGLEANTSGARRAVYDKARNALISQLKAIDPPLPTAEISRQRLELEEAIRRVEREAASGAPTVAEGLAEAPAAAGRPESREGAVSPQDVFRRAIQDAGRRSAGVAQPLERGRPDSRVAHDAAADEPSPAVQKTGGAPPPPHGYGEQEQPGGEPRLAPDYDWDPDLVPPPRRPSTSDESGRGSVTRRGRGGPAAGATDLMARRALPSRAPAMMLLAMIVVVVGGVAALVWYERDNLPKVLASFDDIFASFNADSGTAPPPQASVADGEPAGNVAIASGKDTDRLVAGDTPDAPVRVVDTPMGGGDTVVAGLPPGEEPGVGLDTGGAHQAALYEEPVDRSAAAQGVVAINAKVAWSFIAQGPSGPEIAANIDVPDRKMKIRLTIRRNTDDTLPASHLVEVVVDTPADFPGGGVKSVPRLVLKESEEARGQPLIGATATITDGFFWIALSGLEADVATNLAMLRDRDWIDLPMIYETGQRAILTIQKGAPGERVFDQALAAWTG